ncbi:MAG: hypothetical protein JSR59_00650 [Proteobacteria bacterium]|nr:hypothetical protein [Pseudomonadota bacterium]
MTPLPIALPRGQRLALYAALAVLTLSGIGWLVATWGSDDAATGASRLAAAWCLRVHGIAAYAALVVVGSILPMHARPGWYRQRNRRSGTVLVALLLWLAVSGLWLYYGTEDAHQRVSLLHWIAGLALPVWVALHRLWGLRARRRRGSGRRKTGVQQSMNGHRPGTGAAGASPDRLANKND